MLRRVLAWMAAVLAGVALGAASAWGAMSIGGASFGQEVGQWTTNRATGSTAADPYTRAIVARVGLLALSSREAIYFNLDRDDRGEPLSESCIYELTGRELDARWWSVTLYADDNYLAQNSDHAASIDASHIPSGRWSARIAPVRGDATYWLSSREARRNFSLTLRVYNPQRDFRPNEETLPQLTRISCAGEAA
ncbi:DUF1214 domain-containing protein [Terricaulis silvestris]|uniref:DUF1214 domain-containing protein n=1 Tax=Terricaulis silvestris TaxID=2686094 RepID=A0A6I6MNU1_9CAUL|nr:DUF1214 domain-containing protein [Terricaulis silvestris]QGZ93222.1 hypothetical protein DSM104635_00028 [Terricaulis silvestris]